MGRTRTVVVLITDLVESTAHDQRRGPNAADAFRREYFGQADGIVAHHDGWLVKSLGDGVMVVFESSTAAIDCAIALQQGLAESQRRVGDPASARVGISAGEVVVEDDDCFGTPVVEAARLCSAANGGEILVADVVLRLTRSLAHPVKPLGAQQLKGLDEPVETHAVDWKPLVPRSPATLARLDDYPEDRIARALDLMGGDPHMSTVRERILELLVPRPGEAFLDVGCGTGSDVMLLSAHVGTEGRVVGVELSAHLVEEAATRAEVAGFAEVEFVVGNAEDLQFADDEFDGVRSDRVLQYLVDPRPALREMRRVTRPGGRVVVADTDWETAVTDSSDDDLTGRINAAWLATRPNGRVGHQLFRHFREAGFGDITVEARTQVKTELELYVQVISSLAAQAVDAGAATAAEASRWVANIEADAARQVFLRSFTTFIVSGRVPGEPTD